MSTSKKYELVMLTAEDDTKEDAGLGHYYIKALKFFVCTGVEINVGDIGGSVDSEANLSQKGLCWIEKGASVIEDAVVEDDALVCAGTKINEKARIGGNSVISNNCAIAGEALIISSIIYSTVAIGGNVRIKNSYICSHVGLCGDVFIINSVLRNCEHTVWTKGLIREGEINCPQELLVIQVRIHEYTGTLTVYPSREDVSKICHQFLYDEYFDEDTIIRVGCKEDSEHSPADYPEIHRYVKMMVKCMEGYMSEKMPVTIEPVNKSDDEIDDEDYD